MGVFFGKCEFGGIMLKGTRKVGKYEVGRTIGEGTFAKVKFAQNRETGDSVAMKVLFKSAILKHRMVDQVLSCSFFLIGLSCN